MHTHAGITVHKPAIVDVRPFDLRVNECQGPAIEYMCTTTAAATASEVEAIIQSPANMAAAKIAAVDFNKMTSN